MSRRILVAGGGTGGHLFPGIALVEELRRRLDVDVLFVGTARGIEARVIPERGDALELLDVTPLKGRSVGGLIESLGKLPGAMSRAANVVRQHRADLVVGVGGYASGPVLAAAAAMGTPTALLEQNAHLGLTNKMLAKVVGRAYLSFEETRGTFGKKARVVGNPVRAELAAWAKRASADPEGFESRASRILVIGGSQGAKALNETVPAGLAKLAPELKRLGLRVVHQTGAAMRDEVVERYAALGLEADVVSFIDDMAQAYASAAVVIARAGATTLAELQAIGRPSILVPYPFAADDHHCRRSGDRRSSCRIRSRPTITRRRTRRCSWTRAPRSRSRRTSSRRRASSRRSVVCSRTKARGARWRRRRVDAGSRTRRRRSWTTSWSGSAGKRRAARRRRRSWCSTRRTRTTSR
ncbi:MAG: undecaprenyldiphospho-muramoylpentapeptide beta-N-acetylglucosaminyltransferase [Myxococcota bacterium]|nr:undecaprenyldiphospho-muramoylpentapeptide beta-N-acetylglucosaminyltransferase [Myxococcota bacterium]